jgi:Xaa-Pro aminopeptidase
MSWGNFGTEASERINWSRIREDRKRRAIEKMKEAGLGAFLAFYEENIRFISSTRGAPWTRDKPGLRYALLTLNGKVIMYEQGDNWYHTKRNCPWLDKVKYSYAIWIKGASGPASLHQAEKFAYDIKKELQENGVADLPVGVDFIDFNMLRAFEKVGIKVVDGLGVIHSARSIKSQDEIELYRIAASIADSVHYEAMKILRPGLTENQVMAHLYKYAYSFPNVDNIVTIIVSSGPNTWPNYRNFTDRVIEYGDLVLIDVVIAYNGYHTCVYRTYSIGKQPTSEQKDYYQIALDWLYKAINVVKPGVTTKDIAEQWPSAKDVWGYREEEEAVANLWGHGLGLSHYDIPLISRINSLQFPYEIKENMTLALETQHGKLFKWGVRIEQMLVVTSTGVEVLNKIPVDEIITV